MRTFDQEQRRGIDMCIDNGYDRGAARGTGAPHPCRRVALAALLLAATLGSAGCGSVREYFGGRSAAEEQAFAAAQARVVCDNSSRRLQVTARGDAETLAITAIDAVSTHSYWRAVSTSDAYPETVLLTPGPHVLGVRYRDAIFSGDGELSLDATAGTTYRLQRRVLGLSVQFWLEDAQGQRVGSVATLALHGADRG